MATGSLLSSDVISKEIKNSYNDYVKLFVGFQATLLSNIYQRYKSIENGHLVLFFARETQKKILRQKDYDLNSDLSFSKFWENHEKIDYDYYSIIKISSETGLPKETTRRKILDLMKKKILGKQNNSTCFLPNEEYKKTYNNFIKVEMLKLASLIHFVSKKINKNISKEKIIENLNKNFSFFWFHYLDAEMNYIKSCKSKIQDLELLLIMFQCIEFIFSKNEKNNNEYKNATNAAFISNLNADFNSVSATFISDLTGIPRATCLRKLDYLVSLKPFKKNQISKKFFLGPDVLKNTGFSLGSQTDEAIKIFSNFYLICLKSMHFEV